VLVLRIDDTDPTRTIAGGEERSSTTRVARRRVRRGARAAERTRSVYGDAIEAALSSGAVARDDDGSIRLPRDGTTLVRADGTATYQLASVVDDLEPRDHARNPWERPSPEPRGPAADRARARRRAPEVIHHGLVLGEDGKKLSKRHGHSSIAELREEGFPPAAVARTSTSSVCPSTTSTRPRPAATARRRRHRRDAGRRARGGAERPSRSCRASRRASLVEAREYARSCSIRSRSRSGRTRADARPLRRAARARPDRLSHDEGRAIVRELKAVGGDLHALRLALTGAKGPELGAVLAARAARGGARRATAPAAPDYDRAVRLYDTYTRGLRELPPPPGPIRIYSCGPTGVPAHPRRQRGAVRRRDVAAELAPGDGLRDEARHQHHRHQRQDLRRGSRRERRARRGRERLVRGGHRSPRPRSSRRRADSRRDGSRPDRDDRGARRSRVRVRVGRGTCTSASRAFRSTDG
jgi:hypothetical protein